VSILQLNNLSMVNNEIGKVASETSGSPSLDAIIAAT
jgi:hypothetical protein